MFTQTPQDTGCKLDDPRLSWNSVFEGYCERSLMNAAVARFAQRVQIFLRNVFHICFRCRQCSPAYLHPCSEAASQFVSGSEAFSIFHTLAFIDISCLCKTSSKDFFATQVSVESLLTSHGDLDLSQAL